MIPIIDGNYGKTDENPNIHKNGLDGERQMCETSACMEDYSNQPDIKLQLFTTRTDKPRLAHEVLLQWIASLQPSNNDVTYTLKQNNLLSKKDLVTAAYSGPCLVFRK